MGKPVVHFEIIGKDMDTLRSYYSELFGWEIDADNPMNYGTVQRDGNTNADGIGIGGGLGVGSGGRALASAENLGGSRMMGPCSRPKGSR